MGRPILAFDADGVIADFHRPYLDCQNRARGTAYTIDHWIHHDLAVALNLAAEEAKLLDEVFKTHARADFWHALPPVPGALEGLAVLDQKYDLVIITSRPDPCRAATLDWFGRHYPGLEIHFATGRNNPYGGIGRMHKPAFAEMLGAVALIDDNADEFIHWDSDKVEPICFAQPWNAYLAATHPRIPRLDWPGVLAKFAPEAVPQPSATR